MINSSSSLEMTNQSYSPQKKEQEETTARDLIKTDTSKMSEPEFTIKIIRLLAGVKNRLESLSMEIKEEKLVRIKFKNAIKDLQC